MTQPLLIGFSDPEFRERVERGLAISTEVFASIGVMLAESEREFRGGAVVLAIADHAAEQVVLDLQSVSVAVHTLIHDIATHCKVSCQCRRNPTMGNPAPEGSPS